MMAQPMKTLDLHYPMIQFLINNNNSGPSTHLLTHSLISPPINRFIDGSIIVETVTRNLCGTDRLKDSSLSGVLACKIDCVSATSKHSGKQDPQEQSEEVNKYMAKKIDEVIMTGMFDLSSFEGLFNFYAYLHGHLSLADITFQKGCIKITVICRTLEILERLWDEYCSGRLNAEAENCLITENVKEKLGMETIKLATTILEEDYLACKFSLMETSCTGAFRYFHLVE